MEVNVFALSYTIMNILMCLVVQGYFTVPFILCKLTALNSCILVSSNASDTSFLSRA